jgi:hypothetical protein
MLIWPKLQFLEFLRKMEDEKNSLFDKGKMSVTYRGARLIYSTTFKCTKFHRFDDYYSIQYSIPNIIKLDSNFFDKIYTYSN